MNAMDKKETERLLKGAKVNPSPQLENRMRALWAEAAGKELGGATRREAAGHQSLSRKRLLRVGVPIAAVCLALLAGRYLLSGRGVMPSAYAELMQAARNSQAAQWLHATGTAGGEEVEGWFSLRPFRTFLKRGDQVEAADAEAHREYKYDPATNTLTVSYVPEVPEEMRQAPSFLAAMLAQLERAEQEGLIEITKRHVLADGRKYEVYTVTLNNEEAMEATLTVDSSTQRLVRIESQASPPGGCGPMELAFDYPDSGPADIYALGVPRDAKVVENLPTTDLLQLHEEVEQARNSFAPSYRAIIWRGHASGDRAEYRLDQLVVVYKKNGRYRLEWGREPVAVSLPGGRGLEELLERLPADDGAALEKWAQQVRPRDVYFNENTIDSKGVRLSLSPEGELQRDTTLGLPGRNTVEDLTWSSPIHKTGEKVFPGKEGQFGPLLGTGYETQGRVDNGDISWFPSRIRRFWNPARDYAREEREALQEANAGWQEDKDWMREADPELIKRRWLSDADKIKDYKASHTDRIVEYGRTPAGQWYAKKIVFEHTSNLRASAPKQMTVIYVDTEAEIPDELLEPESVTSEMLAPSGVWQAEFDKAVAIIDGRETWPATPRELAEAYWKARNAKDWDEMAVLWPGSAAWHRVLADEVPVEYVFGEAERDRRPNQAVVPYAPKNYHEKHGTYNLKMRLSNAKSSKGRYYVVSGN